MLAHLSRSDDVLLKEHTNTNTLVGYLLSLHRCDVRTWSASHEMCVRRSPFPPAIGIEDQLKKSKFLGHLPLHCLPFDFL